MADEYQDDEVDTEGAVDTDDSDDPEGAGPSGRRDDIAPPDGRAEDPETGERISSREARERQAAEQRKGKSARRGPDPSKRR